MSGNEDDAGGTHDQLRVPTPLREQVDELFVEHQGYEPASFQEALSLVVDIADDHTHADSGEATADDRDDGSAGSGPSRPESGSAAGAGPQETVSADQLNAGGARSDASTTIEAVSVDAADGDSVSFDDYVDGLDATEQDPSPAVESILDTEHADSVVRELAAEVLDEMTQEAFRELEHGVDHGVGAGVTDGMGATRTADGSATAPSGTTGDGVPDSLTADPESDCAVCGRAHRVSVLQTTILDEDGSVVLVCPSCAE